MKRSQSTTRDQLLALLRKHIDECVSARDDMSKTIETLLEAERKLIRGEEAEPLSSLEPEHLPYRLQAQRVSASEAPSSLVETPSLPDDQFPPVETAEDLTSVEKSTIEPVQGTEPPLQAESPSESEESAVEPENISAAPQEEPQVNRHSRSRTWMPEVSSLEKESYELIPKNAPKSSIPPPNMNSPSEMDNILQEDQIHLLRTQEEPKRHPHPEEERSQESRPTGGTRKNLPFQHHFNSDEDLELSSPPGGTQNERKPPASGGEYRGAALLPPPLQQLMNYIRAGGAIRCIDPWEQNCAAFLLSPTGSAIFATDVFMNYLRKSLNTLRNLLQESLSGGEISTELPSFLELESRKDFLGKLVGALRNRRTKQLQAIDGLQVAGHSALPSTFEFEQSTLGFIHTGLLDALHELFQYPVDAFFQSGGAFSEIGEFVNKYREFTRNLGEEKQAASMLRQMGMEANRPSRESHPRSPSRPGQGQDDTGATSDLFAISEGLLVPPEDTSSFMEEGKDLQDLNTFDFDPDDRKSIMRQEEKPLSSSKFKKIQNPASPDEATETGVELGAISPAGESTSAPGNRGPSPAQQTREEEGSFNLDEFEKMLTERNSESSRRGQTSP